MHLARHSITPASRTNIIDAQFDADTRIFTASTPSGFAIYRTWPLALLRKRETPNGTLAKIVPLHSTSLLFLVGGGRSPLYPPNKVIAWDDKQGKAVAELEYNEKVAGLACRRGWLVVALKRRVLIYQVKEEKIERWGEEWKTCPNERGVLALASAPNSTLLAFPARQTGHVQLLHLPPCPGPPPPPIVPPSTDYPLNVQPSPNLISATPPSRPGKPVAIVLAHETALRTIAVPPSGNLVATASNKGTLVRIWNAHTGKLVRELRRGTDKAEIYGIAFRRDEKEVCVWSDKGTVHVFKLGNGEGESNRHSTFSPLSPYLRLPKYFASEWSYAQYRLPSPSSNVTLASSATTDLDADAAEEEKCVVGWIQVPVPPPPPATPTSPSHLSPSTSPNKHLRHRQKKEQEKEKEKPDIYVEHQLVALTYSGGWYRLSFPPSSSSSASVTAVSSAPSGVTMTGSISELQSGRSKPSAPPTIIKSSKGKERERRTSSEFEGSVGGSTAVGSAGKIQGKEHEGSKEGRACVLEEFRRFGRWDGWG